ncbi:hypothetical protein AX15_007677 [Amanita polypyramis BW_CC]|nr:hypothetical protein AX15_007677 [Amanita polypyramis BW_CC]
MRSSAQGLLKLLSLATAVQALSWTATPFDPAAIPLAVRTPYLSAWLAQGTGAALNDIWPTFWTGQTIGWAGFINVDGVSYCFLGAPNVSGTYFNKAVQRSFQFTATQSIFVLSAGPVDLTVKFLSPVEPNDLVKQSIPFSYLAISIISTDGHSHRVQIYSDISAEWVSGDNTLVATWSTSAGSIVTHQVQLQNQTLFGEVKDHTQYGSAYYSTISVSMTFLVTNTILIQRWTASTTDQTAADVVSRAQFINNGYLKNTQDTNFRAIQNNWPVFSLAQDLGSVTSTIAPVVFAIGHVRDPAIEYIVANDRVQFRSIYSLSQFSTIDAMILSFINDYTGALSRAQSFDAELRSSASTISSRYADIVALSLRQAFGAMEITISNDGGYSSNTNDVLVFLKEISSDGISHIVINVNTVDVIFPTWPVLLYTNPMIGRYLLEGLLRYQATGQYPNKWACHDLGASYPEALGHNDGNNEPMPVEGGGNMVIMVLSYAQKTGDNSQIQRYYDLLDQWTQFLISDSLIPANQISTDDFAGLLANQTNLAIKGIVGIKAMSEIANLLGNMATASNYSSIVASYVAQWQSLSASLIGPHLTLSYGDSNRLVNSDPFPLSLAFSIPQLGIVI